MKPLFLIDCDGVMLDYNQAFKEHYEKIYQKTLTLTKPKSYQAVEMWGVGDMSKEDYHHFKKESAKLGMWENMPALPDALEFVQEISQYFTVWCLTSMPVEYEQERLRNLQNLGFPIEKVIATSRIGTENPKKKFVEKLKPAYFMDDLLQNFVDISSKLKTKLVFLDWKHEDSPNQKYSRISPHITINHYEDFYARSDYYIKSKKFVKISLSLEESVYFNHVGHAINGQAIPASFDTKQSIERLHKKYMNHYLEGEFTQEDFHLFDSLVKNLQEQLKDWTIEFNFEKEDNDNIILKSPK